MKALDFVFQKLGLVVTSGSLLVTTITTDFLIVLVYMMALLAFYQIIHFFVYLPYLFAKRRKIKLELLMYPVFIAVFAIFWTQFTKVDPPEWIYLLLAANAITIGGYYTYTVHKKFS